MGGAEEALSLIEGRLKARPEEGTAHSAGNGPSASPADGLYGRDSMILAWAPEDLVNTKRQTGAHVEPARTSRCKQAAAEIVLNSWARISQEGVQSVGSSHAALRHPISLNETTVRPETFDRLVNLGRARHVSFRATPLGRWDDPSLSAQCPELGNTALGGIGWDGMAERGVYLGFIVAERSTVDLVLATLPCRLLVSWERPSSCAPLQLRRCM